MEETIILEKVKAGDAAAFSLLYDLYWLKVYNFARLYITSSSVISEVVQDVFVKVWESKEFLDITKNFDGLLFMITRNIIFNYSRRHFNELNFKMTVLKGLENSYDIEDFEEPIYEFDAAKRPSDLYYERERYILLASSLPRVNAKIDCIDDEALKDLAIKILSNSRGLIPAVLKASSITDIIELDISLPTFWL